MKKILCLFGTRPEAIKMAPVIRALKARKNFEVLTLCTGQHRELLEGILDWFDVPVDRAFDVMEPGQSLGKLTASLLRDLEKAFLDIKPDLVIAQGDTTTVFCASLACFYLRIPFGHVEAGLRTGNLDQPYPEEFNRIAADRLSQWHFCPTKISADNLKNEALNKAGIFVTGNTVIDALIYTKNKIGAIKVPDKSEEIPVLVTTHRRENFGKPLENICEALLELCAKFPKVKITLPVHPNPNVVATVNKFLGTNKQIRLVKPLSYRDLVEEMERSRFILTDSGGIQEEAPALGKPILVLREKTERPEAVETGAAKIVGTETADIVKHCVELITSEKVYKSMQRGSSPYGDGKASERIADILSTGKCEPFDFDIPPSSK